MAVPTEFHYFTELPKEIRIIIWTIHLETLPPVRHTFGAVSGGLMYGVLFKKDRYTKGRYKNTTLENCWRRESHPLFDDPFAMPAFMKRIHFPGQVYVANGPQDGWGFWHYFQFSACMKLSSVSVAMNFKSDYDHLGAEDPDFPGMPQPLSACIRSSPADRLHPLPHDHWLFKVRNLVLESTGREYEGSLLYEVDRDIFQRHEALEQVLVVCAHKQGRFCDPDSWGPDTKTGFIDADNHRSRHEQENPEDGCGMKWESAKKLASTLEEIFASRGKSVAISIVVNTAAIGW